MPINEDRIMFGVDTTGTGATTGLVVVDDPHGYVAPSAGVEIIGRRVPGYMWHRMAQLRGDVLDRMVSEPRHGKSDIVMVKMDEVPKLKGPKPKVRKLAKGLRP